MPEWLGVGFLFLEGHFWARMKPNHSENPREAISPVQKASFLYVLTQNRTRSLHGPTPPKEICPNPSDVRAKLKDGLNGCWESVVSNLPRMKLFAVGLEACFLVRLQFSQISPLSTWILAISVLLFKRQGKLPMYRMQAPSHGVHE